MIDNKPALAAGELGDLHQAERAAAERVAAISARRSEMARAALALQEQLARLAQAADAVVEESLGDLFVTANQVRVPDNTQAAEPCHVVIGAQSHENR